MCISYHPLTITVLFKRSVQHPGVHHSYGSLPIFVALDCCETLLLFSDRHDVARSVCNRTIGDHFLVALDIVECLLLLVDLTWLRRSLQQVSPRAYTVPCGSRKGLR